MVKPGTIIEDERRCAGCGYDLRGLPFDGICPECARPISEAKVRIGRITGPELGAAPGRYLLLLALGLVLAGSSGVALPIALNFLVMGWDDSWWLAIGLAGGPAWWIGLMLAGRRRPTEGSDAAIARREGVHRRLLAAVGLTQPAWAGVFACLYLAAHGAAWARPTAAALAVIAAVGLPAVAILLSCISDWAVHEGLTRRLRGTAWVVGACPVVGLATHAVISTGVPIVVYLLWVRAAAVILWLLGFLAIGLMCFEMLGMLAWARINAHEAARRDARLAATRAAFEAGVAARTAGLLAEGASTPDQVSGVIPFEAAHAEAANPKAGGSAPVAPAHFRDDVIIRPTPGVTPYPMEPDQ